MLTKVLIMRPGQADETIQLADLPRAPGYEMLRDIVTPLLDGANLEHTMVLADFDGSEKFAALDMFVDTFGLVKELPRNEAATTLYRRANQMGRTAAPKASDPEMLNFICGPAVLFNRRVWF